MWQRIACEGDVVYTWAGPEIAVAPQRLTAPSLSCFICLRFIFSRCRGQLTQAETDGHILQLLELPEKVKSILSDCENINISPRFTTHKEIFFMGATLTTRLRGLA